MGLSENTTASSSDNFVNQCLICEHSTIGFGTCRSTHGTWHG